MEYSEQPKDGHNESLRKFIETMDFADTDQPLENRLSEQLLEFNLIYRQTIGKVGGGDKSLDNVSDADLDELRIRTRALKDKINEILPPEIFE